MWYAPDTPSGNFNFNSPGTQLATVGIIGTGPPQRFIFDWTHHVVSLNASGATNSQVTLVWDVIGGFYAAFDNLLITASGVAAAPEIDVRGNSVAIGNGNAIPSTADHSDFGSIDISSGSVVRTFTINNTGDAALTLGANAVSLSGTGSSHFSITSQPAPSVAALGSTTFQITFDPSIAGTHLATIAIANNDSDESLYTFAIQGTGTGGDSNQPPVVAANNTSVTVDEGQTATNNGTVSDPNGDPVTLSASVGTVVNNGNGTWSWSLITTDGPANQTVTITADDGNGGTSSTSFALTVNNVAPTVNAGPDQTVFRNDTVTVSGSWSDPAGALDNPYTWSWDLNGDLTDSGSANYGDTIVRTTSFVVDGDALRTFAVTDQDGATGSDTVKITVVNRAPTANNQSVSTNEDTPLPITLTGGDADNDTLTYSMLIMPPLHGMMSGTAPNLTYTPDPDYVGPDSFTFKVNDGLADSNVAAISINVASVNDPAVALDDSAMTGEDTPVSIPVQANDSAGPVNENQTLTTSAVNDPPHGTAVINPDGSVTYTPDLDYNGPDSFTYTVCDAEGACASATVTVLVNTVNDPPVATDDTVTTPEDAPVTFNVLANDSDVDGNLNPGSVTVVSGSANGTLVHNGNGSFTYTPDANYNGPDSFSYEVCDSDGVCDTADVAITVTPVNDAPVCSAVTPSVAVLWPPNHQLEPVTVSGVTDEEGNAITISITAIFQDEPTNGLGDGDTAPDGQGIGGSTAQVRVERKGNGNGRYYHIGFSASDGQGGSCTGTVKVNVPKSQGKNGAAVDDGPFYNSTLP